MSRKKIISVVLACLLVLSTGCSQKSDEIPNVNIELPNNDIVVSEQTEEVSQQETQSGEIIEPESEKVEETTVPELVFPTLDTHPSTEEILACIDAGESKLYWMAEISEYSETIDILSVETSDIKTFGTELSELLGTTYTLSYNAELAYTIQLIPSSSNSEMETLLGAMSQITGMEYTEVVPPENYVTMYVPTVNGYCVDDEGYFYSGARAGEGEMGSYVAVSEDGTVDVLFPLILSGSVETVNTVDLVTPETVKTICQEYYKSTGLPRVTVITNISLIYYYSENQLLPAWRCDMTMYMSENGHANNVMLDAQTGELVRK